MKLYSAIKFQEKEDESLTFYKKLLYMLRSCFLALLVCTACGQGGTQEKIQLFGEGVMTLTNGMLPEDIFINKWIFKPHGLKNVKIESCLLGSSYFCSRLHWKTWV